MSLSNELGLDKIYPTKKKGVDWSDPDFCWSEANRNGNNLKFVQDQTIDIICAAIGKNTGAYNHIKNKTYEVNLAVVKVDGLVIQHIKDPSKEIILAAVSENGCSLKFIKEADQTEEVVLTAVNSNPSAIRFALFQNEEICLRAISETDYGDELIFIKNQTEEMILIAVKKSYRALDAAHFQNKKICDAAVRAKPQALRYVKNQTKELILEAMDRDLSLVDYIDQNVIPMSEWDIKWFDHIRNAETRRKFIQLRGVEIIKKIRPEVIDEDKEYCLVRYKIDDRVVGFSKALIFKCPSSGDLYFSNVPDKTKTLTGALKFLNTGTDKDKFAYES